MTRLCCRFPDPQEKYQPASVSDERLRADAWGAGVTVVGATMIGPVVGGALVTNELAARPFRVPTSGTRLATFFRDPVASHLSSGTILLSHEMNGRDSLAWSMQVQVERTEGQCGTNMRS